MSETFICSRCGRPMINYMDTFLCQFCDQIQIQDLTWCKNYIDKRMEEKKI
jgi:hypothetical protein